ncbi:hypothetical protein V8C86DRAFT_2524449, partial [Haematococcus lacustris]
PVCCKAVLCVMYWYQVCNGSVWALTWAATCAAPILSTLLLLNGFRAVSHPALVMGTGRYTRARCSSAPPPGPVLFLLLLGYKGKVHCITPSSECFVNKGG